MARYHAKNCTVYMSASGSTAATPALSLATVSMDFSTDKVETTSFLDPNKTYVQGLKDIKGAIAGFLDDTYLGIFASADSADGVKLYIYPSSNAPTVYWYGPAWLDMSVALGVSAAATISGNFVANGAWGRKP